MNNRSPMFSYVCAMNAAFGNAQGVARQLLPPPAGDAQARQLHDGAWQRLQKQCENIGGRLQPGDPTFGIGAINIINGEVLELLEAIARRDLDGVRDALCDIMVFALGAFHIAGLDADADMTAVLDGVMTRFCRNEEELDQTVERWAKKGITRVHTHGAFPTLCVKATEDQTADNGEFIPAGKFLKSVGYRDTVFPPLPAHGTPVRRFFGSGLSNEKEQA